MCGNSVVKKEEVRYYLTLTEKLEVKEMPSSLALKAGRYGISVVPSALNLG
jgi:hypothetical protein